MDRRQKSLVEDLVKVVQWHDRYAQVECPGGHTDAIVYVDKPVPYLHCLHEKCQSDIAEINREFWLQSDDLPEFQKPEPIPEEIAARKWKKRLAEIAQTARQRVLPKLPPVPPEMWSESSPIALKDVPVEDHWHLFLTHLYAPDDLIWCGERHESGPAHKDKFQPVSEWLKRDAAPGPQVSVFNFKRGALETGNRKRLHTQFRRYYVLEGDEDPHNPGHPYPKEKFGSVLVYAQKIMKLRAIVDAGNKSWHAYFKPPEFEHLPYPRCYVLPIFEGREISVDEASDRDLYRDREFLKALRERDKRQVQMEADYRESLRRAVRKECELLAILAGFGCDKNMLKSNLTARLPGIERRDNDGALTGRWQRLVYLDPKL